eukprot:sb/3474375/
MANPVAELKDSESTSEDQDKVVVDNAQKKLSTVQSLAFVLPDILLFVNNLFFNLLITAIPERMRLADKTNTTHTVLMMNLVNVFSLISSIGLSVTSSYISTVFWMMLAVETFSFTTVPPSCTPVRPSILSSDLLSWGL